MTVRSWCICDLGLASSLRGVRFTFTLDGSKRDYDDLVNKHIDIENLKYQIERRAGREVDMRDFFQRTKDALQSTR
jgi:hypothetical protein